ncbi:MAG: isoprenyl transferase [Hydrogenovibrio sp.]|uniref:isoprenyl transferase n=1 Tax=Hydrogenovibrio sp. TaxID=2065821 RepID=UPI002870047B|nr:isoprenyl transferase [Hydrogenovibrio sp.]MDR9497627.1 isoprenyl transferase [Hydrogenovibrio sp.]
MSESSNDSPIPRHIAIIMDGNGRWAKKRMLPRFVGHKKGVNALKRVITRCGELGVASLTLFAFSTENWKRPQEEVNKLMGLFLEALQNEVSKLHENGVRLRVIGDRSAFSEAIQAHIARAEALTADNRRLNLNVAANYGGRADIVQAVKSWQKAHPEESIEALTPEVLTPFLALSDQCDPDLLIRTGGEQRVSNFMIWQMAYTEYYFTPTLWPDFDEAQVDLAVASYQQRERRFGQTSEQVSSC